MSKYGNLVNEQIVYAQYASKIGNQTRVTDTLTKAEANSLGFKELHLDYPSTPAGDKKHWEMDGYEETDTDITRKYKAVDDPVIPRKFSKLKIYGTIASFDANKNTPETWAKIRAWLEAKTINGMNGWMSFQLAREISEDHPMFKPLAKEAQELLGLTDEQFEALLNACILEC